MRGRMSEDQRVYHYESPFYKNGENNLSLSQLRSFFITTMLRNPHAKYTKENYALEKKNRHVTIWRKDGKTLSEREQNIIDKIIPDIFDTN